MSILDQNAIMKSIFFQHGFDPPYPPPLLNNVKKNWKRATVIREMMMVIT